MVKTAFADLTRLPASYDLGDLIISREAGPLLPGVRKTLKSDVIDFFSDPFWMANGWEPNESAPLLTTRKGIKEICGYYIEPTPARLDYWAMAREPYPHLVGHVSLDTPQGHEDMAYLPPARRMALIGISIFQSCRGRGLGSRMTLAATELALQNGVTAICAETKPDNMASRRALQQAGLTELGQGPVSAATAEELDSPVAVRFMRLASGRKPDMKKWPFLPRHAAKAVP